MNTADRFTISYLVVEISMCKELRHYTTTTTTTTAAAAATTTVKIGTS